MEGMSAYSKEPASLTAEFERESAMPPQVTETFPALPPIGREVELFFSAARQMETLVAQLRSQNRKIRDEMAEMQVRCSRIVADAEMRLKEANIRENRDKDHISALQKTERLLQDLVRERDALKAEAERIQVDRMEERRRLELDLEIARASGDTLKNREEAMKSTVNAFAFKEKAYETKLKELTRDLGTARDELQKYQTAWTKVVAADRAARSKLGELGDLKARVQDLTDALAKEKHGRDELEEAVRREKRDKQIALSCMQKAELRVADLEREIVEIRDHLSKKIDHAGLELGF